MRRGLIALTILLGLGLLLQFGCNGNTRFQAASNGAAANLALNPAQTLQTSAFCCDLHDLNTPPRHRHQSPARRSRSALATTLTELSAMAAAAKIGLNSTPNSG